MMYMLIIFSNFGVKASIEKGYGNTTQDCAAHGGWALGCKNRPDPFLGWMSHKATKHGFNFLYFIRFVCVTVSFDLLVHVCFCLRFNVFSMTIIDWLGPLGRYGDCAGNTVEENSSVFSLIRMH